MDYQSRRNQRGRPRTRPVQFPIEYSPRKRSVINDACGFLILIILIAIICLMLGYHCTLCTKKCDIYNITKAVDEIAHNMSIMKNFYHDLELNVLKFSQDLPKIEGQVEILEALAHSMERGDFVWNPKTHLALPNVGVFIKRGVSKEPNLMNTSVTSSKFTSVGND